MQIYLVGGAVRDKQLGLPVREKDWVVVGGTAEELETQGYRMVGKSFPVFLHPETGEEYALARTETKTGPGYRGFVTHSDTKITLEQDLKRRDLTINAMAEDSDGTIIDPHGGLKDLNLKVLRHVSDAFHEDPLRILRVARFAARYHELGFTVAEDTLELMAVMTGGFATVAGGVMAIYVGMLENVPGIGAVLIGEGDLGQELGYPRQYDHPALLEAIAEIVAVSHEHGAIVGHPHANAGNMQRLLDEGFRFLMTATARSDTDLEIGLELTGRP